MAAKTAFTAQKSAIRRLLHEVTDVAERKVLDILWTLGTVHEFKPLPANFDAPSNVFSIVFTLFTFHPVRSPFIATALEKVLRRVVTAAVFHDSKPVPSNFSAS